MNLLFISPVVPSFSGKGREKRAAHWLSVLNKSYEVDCLYVLDKANTYYNKAHENTLRVDNHTGLIKKIFFERHLNPTYWTVLKPDACEALHDTFRNKNYDIILVFRLYLFPVAKFFFKLFPDALQWLDIDDIESSTNKEISQLEWKRGKFKDAIIATYNAITFKFLENKCLPKLDKLFVCSQHDKAILAKYNVPIEIFDNKVIAEDKLPLLQTTNNDGLFVGSLDYPPNREAVYDIIEIIAPHLSSRGYKSFKFHIVGHCTDTALITAMHQATNVEYHSDVKELKPIYEQCSFVICPLRGGGGTRLKIIEAFKYGRPVVATTKGIEGIEATHEVHALISDTVEDIADNIIKLIDTPSLYEKLVSSASALCSQRYMYSISSNE